MWDMSIITTAYLEFYLNSFIDSLEILITKKYCCGYIVYNNNLAVLVNAFVGRIFTLNKSVTYLEAPQWSSNIE